MQSVLTALIVVSLSGVPSLASACAALCMPMMTHSAPEGDAIGTDMPDCCPTVSAPAVDPAIRTLTVSTTSCSSIAVDAASATPPAPPSIARALHDPPISPPAPPRATAVLRI